MKNMLLLMFLGVFTLGKAQVSGVVHDPKNNVQLVQLGAFLAKIREQGKEALKVLETANAIREYTKASEFVRTIEESYCVIQDLDLYLDLSEKVGLKNQGCFNDLSYRISLQGIENSIWQTSMALQSAVMTLGERQRAIQDAFDNLKESNKTLNTMKEGLRQQYESRIDHEQSFEKLAELF